MSETTPFLRDVYTVCVSNSSNELAERRIGCPYCGESIDVLIDASVVEQSYIEDCQVCCRPIGFQVTVDFEGDVSVMVSHENE